MAIGDNGTNVQFAVACDLRVKWKKLYIDTMIKFFL